MLHVVPVSRFTSQRRFFFRGGGIHEFIPVCVVRKFFLSCKICFDFLANPFRNNTMKHCPFQNRESFNVFQVSRTPTKIAVRNLFSSTGRPEARVTAERSLSSPRTWPWLWLPRRTMGWLTDLFPPFFRLC